jgi:hypothetical protein
VAGFETIFHGRFWVITEGKSKGNSVSNDWQPRDNDELHGAVHRPEGLRLARQRGPAPPRFVVVDVPGPQLGVERSACPARRRA